MFTEPSGTAEFVAFMKSYMFGLLLFGILSAIVDTGSGDHFHHIEPETEQTSIAVTDTRWVHEALAFVLCDCYIRMCRAINGSLL